MLLAVVLCVGIFAATSAVARADDFMVGRVAQLSHFPGQAYFVKVQTTTDRLEVQISHELYESLGIGDTVVLRGDTWSLLHKGLSEGSIGMGEKVN